jgi:hypothetical protein
VPEVVSCRFVDWREIRDAMNRTVISWLGVKAYEGVLAKHSVN